MKTLLESLRKEWDLTTGHIRMLVVSLRNCPRIPGGAAMIDSLSEILRVMRNLPRPDQNEYITSGFQVMGEIGKLQALLSMLRACTKPEQYSEEEQQTIVAVGDTSESLYQLSYLGLKEMARSESLGRVVDALIGIMRAGAEEEEEEEKDDKSMPPSSSAIN